MKRPPALLVSLILLAAICTSTIRYPDVHTVTICRMTVDAMSSLTEYLTIPKHLLEGQATKMGGEFDVNAYFSVLDALSTEPGYTLDYVYSYGGNQGFPLVHARPTDQPPYKSSFEYQEAKSIPDHWFSEGYAYKYVDYLHDYLQHVQVDDTADGYFQFVVLLIMGDQFYLDWHSHYHDEKIICDIDGLETILDNRQPTFPAEVKQEVRALSYAPTVEFRDDMAIVRVVVFTKWGGFIEKLYTISRDFPHRIIDWEFKTLVPYDCNCII